ncbi:MAG TPA: alpha/beta hydrolase [Acidimicrobiales bacterium]|nr:alpha/beta hydrolase [Acidimicrobiales bacterium]
MPTATCNGIDVYYERSGEGPRLLFLNGSGSTLVSSALVIAPFRQCFDTLAHDQRGLGRTQIPPGPYSMADYAADALALLDHVGWETCRVFGISFGGMVAQELAVTAPARVERLALVCTSGGGDAGASYPLHEREAGPQVVDTRFTPEWLADPEHARDAALVNARNAAPKPTDPDLQRGMREQLLARSHHDVADRLYRVGCPTLVAGGRFDGIAPPQNSEAIAARIKGADLRLYDGGHAFLAQDRRAFPDVLAFLSA